MAVPTFPRYLGRPLRMRTLEPTLGREAAVSVSRRRTLGAKELQQRGDVRIASRLTLVVISFVGSGAASITLVASFSGGVIAVVGLVVGGLITVVSSSSLGATPLQDLEYPSDRSTFTVDPHHLDLAIRDRPSHCVWIECSFESDPRRRSRAIGQPSR